MAVGVGVGETEPALRVAIADLVRVVALGDAVAVIVLFVVTVNEARDDTVTLFVFEPVGELDFKGERETELVAERVIDTLEEAEEEGEPKRSVRVGVSMTEGEIETIEEIDARGVRDGTIELVARPEADIVLFWLDVAEMVLFAVRVGDERPEREDVGDDDFEDLIVRVSVERVEAEAVLPKERENEPVREADTVRDLADEGEFERVAEVVSEPFKGERVPIAPDAVRCGDTVFVFVDTVEALIRGELVVFLVCVKEADKVGVDAPVGDENLDGVATTVRDGDSLSEPDPELLSDALAEEDSETLGEWVPDSEENIVRVGVDIEVSVVDTLEDTLELAAGEGDDDSDAIDTEGSAEMVAQDADGVFDAQLTVASVDGEDESDNLAESVVKEEDEGVAVKVMEGEDVADGEPVCVPTQLPASTTFSPHMSDDSVLMQRGSPVTGVLHQ